MPGHRIRAGTFSVSAMTSTYDVALLPKQSDQGNLRWFDPVDPSASVKEFAATFEGMDGSLGGFGNYEFSWYFGALTAGMVAYLRTTYFGTALFATLTVRTWDRAYGWRVFNATARWNDPALSAEGAAGMNGYLNLRIDFVNATLASA